MYILDNIYDYGILEMYKWCFLYMIKEVMDQDIYENELNGFVINYLRDYIMCEE